jgi:hypothetical protein
MAGITGDQMDTLNAIAIQMFEMPFDQLTSEAKKDVLEAARPNERAGGGMMDINRMTAPLGYREAGEVGIRERIYDSLTPNEKISDEQLRLQGINPSSVLPEERPMAKNNPEGILQGLFRELIGAKKAEGSTLVDFIKSKRSRLMSEVSGEMMGNIFGTGVNEDKIKILKIEIDKLTEQLNDLGEN